MGGPVVPKWDCPHVDRHVRLGKLDNLNIRDFLNGRNIMEVECQHYGALRRRMSRKRLRGEEEAEEDVATIDDKQSSSNKKNKTQGKGNEGDVVTSLSCPKGENWLCLECGVLLCSRYANGHARMHWEDTKLEEEAAMIAPSAATTNETTVSATATAAGVSEDGASKKISGAEKLDKGADGAGHCIAVSLADLSVWCYECNAYLQHPSLEYLTRQLENLKFDGDDRVESGNYRQSKDQSKNDEHVGEEMKDAMQRVDCVGEGDKCTNVKSEVNHVGQNVIENASSSKNKRKGKPKKLLHYKKEPPFYSVP